MLACLVIQIPVSPPRKAQAIHHDKHSGLIQVNTRDCMLQGSTVQTCQLLQSSSPGLGCPGHVLCLMCTRRALFPILVPSPFSPWLSAITLVSQQSPLRCLLSLGSACTLCAHSPGTPSLPLLLCTFHLLFCSQCPGDNGNKRAGAVIPKDVEVRAAPVLLVSAPLFSE